MGGCFLSIGRLEHDERRGGSRGHALQGLPGAPELTFNIWRVAMIHLHISSGEISQSICKMLKVRENPLLLTRA